MSHGRSPMEGDRPRESGLTFQASPKSPGAHGAACANPVGAITSLTSTTDGTIRSIAPALNAPAAARSCAGRIPEPTGSVHLQEPVDKPELVARRGIFPQGKAQQERRSRPSTAAQRSPPDKGRRPQGIPAPHNVAAALQNHHHALIRCQFRFFKRLRTTPRPLSADFLAIPANHNASHPAFPPPARSPSQTTPTPKPEPSDTSRVHHAANRHDGPEPCSAGCHRLHHLLSDSNASTIRTPAPFRHGLGDFGSFFTSASSSPSKSASPCASSASSRPRQLLQILQQLSLGPVAPRRKYS